MGNELTAGALDPDRIMHSWPDLLWQPIQSQAEHDVIVAGIMAVSVPAKPNWILARVAALLTGYYAADVPAEIIRFEAEDWQEALREFPDWAITKAVRWWKGEENPDRRKRPIIGDIAIRARYEMGAVFVARQAVERFEKYGAAAIVRFGDDKLYQPLPENREERQRIAEDVLQQVGFMPKRMP